MNKRVQLVESEVKQFVDDWYAKLDVHAPAAEFLPLLTDEELVIQLPEATLHTKEEFVQWYEGVTRKFFDETHTMKTLSIDTVLDQANVQLVVNWQAHIWNPPAAKSAWLGFDAAQRWIVKCSPQTGNLVIATYIVDELAPMPGSTPL